MRTSKPGWERCKELAEKDLLTGIEVGELTGLAPDGDLLRGLQTPCSPSELVSFADEKIELPSKFRFSLSSHKETRRFDQWRDEWIDALKKNGIADAPIDYRTFLSLTTFDEGNLDEDVMGYQLVRDKLGDVSGIASNYVLKHYAEGGLKVEADTRTAARLNFPTTAKELIVWIRNQSGAVQLTDGIDDADAGAFAMFLPVTTFDSSAPSVSSKRGNRRDNPGREAILEALKEINAKKTSNPRDVEKDVRNSLLEAAKKASQEFPFQNDNGKLKVRRSGSWNACDREALVKRIENALPSLSDNSQ